MSTATHTPGPWAWDEQQYALRPVNPDPDRSAVHTILQREGGNGFLGSDWRATLAELDADYKLIEAAPLLLAALKAARTWMASDCESFLECHTGPAGLDQIATDAVASYRRMLDAMDAAIAAAETQA